MVRKVKLFLNQRDFVEVQGEYLNENTLKDIKFIEDEDFLKSIDLTSTKKDLQTLNFIGNEIKIDCDSIPM